MYNNNSKQKTKKKKKKKLVGKKAAENIFNNYIWRREKPQTKYNAFISVCWWLMLP